MNIVGRARNARLNQARSHIAELRICLDGLCGYSMNERVTNEICWTNGRDALERLIQCFHEANAYNNAMTPARHSDDRTDGRTDSEVA